MGLLGIDQKTVKSLQDDRLRTAALGLASEVGEVAQHVNKSTRPWANEDQEAFKEEAIDVLFYLLEVFVLLGMDKDDILKAYGNKMHKLITRIDTGQKET